MGRSTFTGPSAMRPSAYGDALFPTIGKGNHFTLHLRRSVPPDRRAVKVGVHYELEYDRILGNRVLTGLAALKVLGDSVRREKDRQTYYDICWPRVPACHEDVDVTDDEWVRITGMPSD